MPKQRKDGISEELPEGEDLLDYEIYTKVVEIPVPQDEGREESPITVTVVNWDLGESALVMSEHGEYKILPKGILTHSYHAQLVPFRVFLEGVAPYDWHDEINAVALTPDQMRHILYTYGYVVKQNLSLAELTKNTLFRGKIPVIKEK